MANSLLLWRVIPCSPSTVVVALRDRCHRTVVDQHLSFLGGRERGITNDLLLIGLASIEPVVMYQVAKDHVSPLGIPHAIWIATLMSSIFFTGSVLHVKSLIREAKNPNWHKTSVLFHLMAVVALLLFAKPWYLAFPLVVALLRTIAIKPGLRPGLLGAVEAAVAVVLVTATVLATT